MKKSLIIIFLFFSSCGIEVPQPIPRLYAPNGVQVFNAATAGGSAATVRITWYGLNPELEFSGYNIYFTDDINSAASYKGVKILCRNFNPRQASFVVPRPFNVSRPFSYDVKKFYYSSNTELFKNGTTYWFFVTAFNQVRNLESPPSVWASVMFLDNIAGF